MFDTHIPNLKLGFSLSAQCLWFSNQQTEWKSGIPEYYIDSQGNSYPYTEESSQDMYLQWLIITYPMKPYSTGESARLSMSISI